MRLAASLEHEGSVREEGKGKGTIVERPAAPATSHHGYHHVDIVTNTVTWVDHHRPRFALDVRRSFANLCTMIPAAIFCSGEVARSLHE